MSLQCQWEEIVKTTEIHILTAKGCEPRSKIAAFDMDGTIICTKSGRVFPINIDDWQLLYQPQVKQTLHRSIFWEPSPLCRHKQARGQPGRRVALLHFGIPRD